MSFEPPYRLSKWMDNLENSLTEEAENIIFDYYGVAEVIELTEEQISEIQEFVDENEDHYGFIMIGFRNIISWWESTTWELENNDDA